MEILIFCENRVGKRGKDGWDAALLIKNYIFWKIKTAGTQTRRQIVTYFSKFITFQILNDKKSICAVS
jgi:hypothetical protein